MTTMLSEVIREARAGAFDHAVSEKLAEVVKAVKLTGKAGELTIKFKIKPNGDSGVSFDPDYSGKVPSESIGTIIMFADDEGNLTRTDPRQAEMFSGPRGTVGGPRMIRDEDPKKPIQAAE